MGSALDFGVSARGSGPGWGHCVVFLGKTLYSHGPANLMVGVNLVPRSHSVTGNVRSVKVRQYTIFHWLLKKGCGNAIYAPIGLFRGALNEGLVFASSCAVLNKCQLCGGKFCFSDAGKALQLRKII